MENKARRARTRQVLDEPVYNSKKRERYMKRKDRNNATTPWSYSCSSTFRVLKGNKPKAKG